MFEGTLEDYLRKYAGKELRVKPRVTQNGRALFYVHVLNEDSVSADFFVDGNIVSAVDGPIPA